jgi:hypothetical protein
MADAVPEQPGNEAGHESRKPDRRAVSADAAGADLSVTRSLAGAFPAVRKMPWKRP